MGKNKWYTEVENGYQAGYRPAGAVKSKQNPHLPDHYHGRSTEPSPGVSISALVRSLRRHWLSVRFAFNRLSVDVGHRKTLLKIGFLAGACYYLLGTDQGAAAFLGGGQRSAVDWTETTELAVGTERSKAKGTAKKEKKAIPKNEVKKSKNDAAPVHVETIKGDRTAAYIRKYSAVARQEMAKYGVPASISLAQGLIESRAGTSRLALENNNHFGMKCFSRNCRKGHCTNHTDDTHKDFFLKFNDPKMSWRAHSILISSGRYAKLKKYGRDYKRWAYGLKSVGYATDKTYAEKLIKTIERYDLHQFDH